MKLELRAANYLMFAEVMWFKHMPQEEMYASWCKTCSLLTQWQML